MTKEFKKMLIDKSEATKRVKHYIDNKLRTKSECARIFGFHRTTLYTKIENDSWTYDELELIYVHFPF